MELNVFRPVPPPAGSLPTNMPATQCPSWPERNLLQTAKLLPAMKHATVTAEFDAKGLTVQSGTGLHLTASTSKTAERYTVIQQNKANKCKQLIMYISSISFHPSIAFDAHKKDCTSLDWMMIIVGSFYPFRNISAVRTYAQSIKPFWDVMVAWKHLASGRSGQCASAQLPRASAMWQPAMGPIEVPSLHSISLELSPTRWRLYNGLDVKFCQLIIHCQNTNNKYIRVYNGIYGIYNVYSYVFAFFRWVVSVYCKNSCL